MALDNNLEVFPALNKIDLPSADPSRIKEVDEMIGLDTSRAVHLRPSPASASTSFSKRSSNFSAAERRRRRAPALMIDSWFDPYQGVVALCRVIEGQ